MKAIAGSFGPSTRVWRWSAGLAVALAWPRPAATPAGQDEETAAVSAKAAASALRWLVAAQNTDGSFGDNPRTPGDVSNTSVAILALLANGSTVDRGPHWRALRRAVEWLLRHTARDPGGYDTGTLIQRKLGQNIDLYMAAVAYAQLLGTQIDAATEKVLHERLTRMVAHIASLQKPNGEWESSYETSLTTISAWLALRQAHDAGVAIHHASPELVVRYLEESCLDPGTGVFRDQKWGKQMRFVTQAGALRVLYAHGRDQRAVVQKATRVLLDMRFDQDVGGRAGGEEFLGALFATHAMRQAADATFAAWYRKIVAALARCQNADGSWLGHHCITGRVFCTACAYIALQTPHELMTMACK
ncbi:MAG: prenyltransferase/squalene oxidase repeat-containing protein [Planctomycetota bacterium]